MNLLVKDLLKKYGKRTVLNIEKLELDFGKIYGIIGPNGAGKSTLLRIIGNLENSTQGKVIYNGTNFNKEVMREMTYISQKPYLFRTSVFNNIAYPLKVRKYDKKLIELKVENMMLEFGIKHLENQLATSLSGGESQKVALARALVFNPRLLLLDEPTANIDPSSIEVIEKLIQKTNRKKDTTILIVTHNVAQARRLCDELVFVKNGRIVEKGKTDSIIFTPKKYETKEFLSLEYHIS